MTKGFVPDRGDLVWLGRAPSDRRPALTLSPKSYNAKTGLALFSPVTARAKGYPFEVPLPANAKISGVILSDQVKSLDWRARRAQRFARLAAPTLHEALARARTLLE